MVSWVLAVVLAQAAQTAPAPVETKLPAGEQVPLETRLDKLKAEQTDVPTRALIQVRNEMGSRFRLIEARFVVDGVEIARRVAQKDKELERRFGPLATELPAGQHVLTAELVYQGRNAGPFSYLDDIRYRVESTLPFATGHLIGPANVEVVAHERPGANVPFEKKPLLTLTSTNTPEGPTVVTPRPAPATPSVPAQLPAPKPGLRPASTTER